MLWCLKREKTRGGDNESSENFEMDILAEGALDKELMVPGKTIDTKNPGRK